jgi:hypothetical protein
MDENPQFPTLFLPKISTDFYRWIFIQGLKFYFYSYQNIPIPISADFYQLSQDFIRGF